MTLRLFVPLVLVLLFPLSLFASEWTLPPEAGQSINLHIVKKKGLSGGLHIVDASIGKNQVELRYKATDGGVYKVVLTHPDAQADGLTVGAFIVTLDPPADKWPSESLKSLKSQLNEIPTGIWQKVEIVRDAKSLVVDLRHIAEAMLDNDELESAETVLSAAQRLLPDDPATQWDNVRLLSQKGEADASRKLAMSIALTDDQAVRSAIEAARRELLCSDPPDVDNALDALLVIPPDKRAAKQANPLCDVAKIATLLEKRGNGFLALAVRKGLIKRFPQCGMVWGDLGRQMLAIHQEDALLELVDGYLQKSPEDPELLRWKARALRRLGRLVDAWRLFGKLYRLTGETRMITIFSTIAATKPRDDTLFKEIEENYSKNPDDLLWAHCYGVVNYYRGNYEVSRNMMDTLKPKLPKNARVYIYGAMSRYEMGDWKGAREWLAELEKIGTADPDIWYCLAVMYHDRDQDLALDYLDRYLEIPPNPDEFAGKRQRAMNYREALVNGDPIPDWQPYVSKPKGCSQSGDAAAFGWLLVLAALGMRLWRRRLNLN